MASVNLFVSEASAGEDCTDGIAVFKILFLLLSLSVFFVSAYGIKAPSLDDFRALLAPFYLLFGVSAPSVAPTVRALGSKQATMGKKIGKVLLGLCLALPILLVLTSLLIFADQAFESFIDGIDFNFGEFLSTVLFGAVLLLLLFHLRCFHKNHLLKQFLQGLLQSHLCYVLFLLNLPHCFYPDSQQNTDA